MLRKIEPHQKEGVRWMLTVRHPALFWEMRLRKTAVAIRRVKLSPALRNILVVGPLCVLPGWEGELEAEEERNIWFVHGDSIKRCQILSRALAAELPLGERVWVLVNKEIHLSVPEIAYMPWDAVILDESRFIANPRAKASQFFLHNFRGVKLRMCLTGTAAPESDLEYFTQIQFLDFANWKESSYWEFRAKHFNQRRFDWVVKPESKGYIQQVLSRNCFFLRRSEVKLGGVKVHERRALELPTRIRSLYVTVMHEFVLEGEQETVKTIWATQRYLWLRYLCSGFVDGELESKHKLDGLADLLFRELAGEQAVVWCSYKVELEAVTAFLRDSGETAETIHGGIAVQRREEYRRAFQAGNIRYLVVQPESFKFGTNLSAAGALVYFSSPESAQTRQQTEDRAVDISRNDSSLIVDLYCLDTVEEDILMAHLRKEGRWELMNRIMRRMRNGVCSGVGA